MKKKLEKLKMPERKMDPDMDMSREDMEMAEAQESPEDEAMESPEYQVSEEEMGVEKKQPAPLDDISDDELMAEIKKRGLMSQLDSGEEDAVAMDEMS